MLKGLRKPPGTVMSGMDRRNEQGWGNSQLSGNTSGPGKDKVWKW